MKYDEKDLLHLILYEIKELRKEIQPLLDKFCLSSCKECNATKIHNYGINECGYLFFDQGNPFCNFINNYPSKCRFCGDYEPAVEFDFHCKYLDTDKNKEWICGKGSEKDFVDPQA